MCGLARPVAGVSFLTGNISRGTRIERVHSFEPPGVSLWLPIYSTVDVIEHEGLGLEIPIKVYTHR